MSLQSTISSFMQIKRRSKVLPFNEDSYFFHAIKLTMLSLSLSYISASYQNRSDV
jgi:hypothetical protein